MNVPAILMHDIHRSFGKTKVLEGVSAEVEKGRAIGLLGRNGEGKTTLFRILLDILACDSGRSAISGHRADGSGRVRLHAGYVPERPMFHNFLTAGSALAMRERMYPNWNRGKALHLARRLELNLETTMRGASKGTLAKTAWICATAHNPDVLLLDEPTSGLDALVRDSVLTQLVSELYEEGKTVLIANHRMEEMLGVLDELWVLSHGRIKERYSIHTLRENGMRVRGKLKAARPSDLFVYEEHASGNFVVWDVLDPQTLDRVRSLNLLDQIEIEPLPLDIIFKLLLKGQEKSDVR